MSKVHFFHAGREGAAIAARQVIEKCLAREENILVRTPDEDSAKRFDEWLWRSTEDSFIPHGLSGDDDADQEPVYITAGTEVPNEPAVLLLFDGASAAVEEIKEFDRVAVAFDDSTRAIAKQIWREVEGAELEPVLVKRDDRGRWKVQTSKPAKPAADNAPAKSESTSPTDAVADTTTESEVSDSKPADSDKATASSATASTGTSTDTSSRKSTKTEAKGSKMAEERTLSLIKPDATERNLTGKINAKLEEAGLRIVAQRRVRLNREAAEAFYAVHKDRPFYGELCEFMSSGPIVAQVLQGENAVQLNRDIMGATNPEEAEEGTIRREFANSLGENSVHGSDSLENAAVEIAFFFSEMDIVG